MNRESTRCVPVDENPVLVLANGMFQAILTECNVEEQDEVVRELKNLMLEERKATLSRLEEEAQVIMHSMEKLNNI